MVESRRENEMQTKTVVVKRQRRKRRMERKEMRTEGKKRRRGEFGGGSRLHGVLHGGNSRKCWPPTTTASPNPATLDRVPPESQTLQLALLKLREAERQKKDAEGKRGHTTGRHQLKTVLLVFPFIYCFMIEFLTNTLAVHWVQAHSKKLLFDSTSLGTL